MAEPGKDFALEQARDAAHGGDGWEGRSGTLSDDLGTVWAPCGVHSECGTLRSVLMHRPGPEIDGITDAAAALWHDVVDPSRAREQHDGLTEVYRQHGVMVHELGVAGENLPNSYFCRDTFVVTPMGAVISRPASRQRAGEERLAAAALARIGVPILHTVHGEGTFEGADVVNVGPDLVFVGRGQRTNLAGAQQVAEVYRAVGVADVQIVDMPYGCGHIDGMINIVDRDVAVIYPTQLPWPVWESLSRRGYRLIPVPDLAENRNGMAVNMVPLAPGVVVAPKGNHFMRQALNKAGVEVIEVEVDELMKGGGACHCMTGVVHRDPV